MARKQFIETPAQQIARILRETEILIAMGEIEQDERLQAQGVVLPVQEAEAPALYNEDYYPHLRDMPV